MVADSVQEELVHGLHARLEVRVVESLHVDLEGDGANIGVEVEEGARRSTDPLADILGIRERSRETNDAHHNGLSRLRLSQ